MILYYCQSGMGARMCCIMRLARTGRTWKIPQWVRAPATGGRQFYTLENCVPVRHCHLVDVQGTPFLHLLLTSLLKLSIFVTSTYSLTSVHDLNISSILIVYHNCII